MRKKVLLGFSGGLDTSFCVKYLTVDKEYEVHTLIVNTGGFSAAALDEIAKQAYSLGVASHHCVDATNEYYQQIIQYLIFANVLKNNTYPLSVSAERMCQAMALTKYAAELHVDAIAHGSTGAGNDQVRFDMIIHALMPNIEIITPIRELSLSRAAEIDYLQKHGVNMNFEKAAYSINKGLWGTSVGGKETLTSRHFLPEDAFPTPITQTGNEEICLHFEKGHLIGINEQQYDNPVAAIQQLQTIAEQYGIGRDIHVGDTIIGIKGRVGFEAAAPMIIIKAHHTLEKHVLTKWQLMIKDQLSSFYGNYLHEGQVLDPVMRDMEAFFASSQQKVTGKVFVQLFPYRFQVNGIESPHDLMGGDFGVYGEMNNAWTGDDVKGFTKIFGNHVHIYNTINKGVLL